MAVHFRDLLKSEGVELSMLNSDTKAWIKEYETIEKSKLPTIKDKETGEFTPNAQAKLNRLNKTIVNEKRKLQQRKKLMTKPPRLNVKQKPIV